MACRPVGQESRARGRAEWARGARASAEKLGYRLPAEAPLGLRGAGGALRSAYPGHVARPAGEAETGGLWMGGLNVAPRPRGPPE